MKLDHTFNCTQKSRFYQPLCPVYRVLLKKIEAVHSDKCSGTGSLLFLRREDFGFDFGRMEKNCKLFMHLMIDTQKEDKCKTNRLGVLKMVHDLALRVMKRY